jgi:hypothetical protein
MTSAMARRSFAHSKLPCIGTEVRHTHSLTHILVRRLLPISLLDDANPARLDQGTINNNERKPPTPYTFFLRRVHSPSSSEPIADSEESALAAAVEVAVDPVSLEVSASKPMVLELVVATEGVDVDAVEADELFVEPSSGTQLTVMEIKTHNPRLSDEHNQPVLDQASAR